MYFIFIRVSIHIKKYITVKYESHTREFNRENAIMVFDVRMFLEKERKREMYDMYVLSKRWL